MTQKREPTITKIPSSEGVDFVIETTRVETPNVRSLKRIVLQPAGYPLRAKGEKKPIPVYTDNGELFEAYAREQWRGYVTQKGEFLFDRGIFPDYAFKVIQCVPKVGKLSNKTTIQLQVDTEPLIQREFPKVSFTDVIGQTQAKQKCKVILEFLKNPEKFGEWAPRNVLFYGPPGTGKTLTARALAGEAKAPIFMVKATELLGMHVGEGASHVHSLFRAAKAIAPSIVFIDEVDAIALDRRFQSVRGDVTEIVNALISELGGLYVNEGVVTIAATNSPDIVDTAVNSRFEELIEFDLPDKKDRAAILELYAKKLPLKVEADFNMLAQETEGMSGRDLKDRVIKTTLHKSLLRKKRLITSEMLLDAVKLSSPDESDEPVRRKNIYS
ncbi:MAG: AAA family ATPase [Candidatus Ranarchaeia archaeon]